MWRRKNARARARGVQYQIAISVPSSARSGGFGSAALRIDPTARVVGCSGLQQHLCDELPVVDLECWPPDSSPLNRNVVVSGR